MSPFQEINKVLVLAMVILALLIWGVTVGVLQLFPSAAWPLVGVYTLAAIALIGQGIREERNRRKLQLSTRFGGLKVWHGLGLAVGMSALLTGCYVYLF